MANATPQQPARPPLETPDAFFERQMASSDGGFVETEGAFSTTQGALCYQALTHGELSHPGYQNGAYFTIHFETAWKWCDRLSGGRTGSLVKRIQAAACRKDKRIDRGVRRVLRGKGMEIRRRGGCLATDMTRPLSGAVHKPVA